MNRLKRILRDTGESASTLIHWGIQDQRWIQQHLPDDRDAVQLLINFSRKRDVPHNRNGRDFGPGPYLAVDTRMIACDILMNIPVDPPHQMRDLLNRRMKRAVGPLIQVASLRITNDKTVKAAPVVIYVFHEIIKKIRIPKKYL